MGDSDSIRDKFKKPLERPSANLPARHMDFEPEGDATPSAQPGALARLLDAVSKMLSPKPQQPQDGQPMAQPAEPPVFRVMVAAMAGDAVDGSASQMLFRALDLIPALKVKPLPRPFQLDTLEDPAQLTATMSAIRHAIALENADLMVWGDVGRDHYRLRLTGPSVVEDDRPGAFGASTRIELPLPLDAPQLDLLYAAVLAAAEASTEIQKAALRRLLPQAALGLEAMAAKPPIKLAMPQQRTIQVVYGHICAATAQVVPPSQADGWLQKAVDIYRASEKRLARTDPQWETGLLHRSVAAVLTARAERAKDKDLAAELWEQAVSEWRIAVGMLSKATMPQEWAIAQTKLGVALYRLDLLTGNTELLREAVQSLQGALSVYSRTETPHRWADIMHNLAQVLEVYGDQLRSPEVLKRAVDSCEAVLEIRTRDRTPLAWAALQNTLGSALFLLDKHTEGSRNLADAITAFAGALEAFQTYGRKGPAQVAARNLAKARKLAEERKGRQIIDPHWAED